VRKGVKKRDSSGSNWNRLLSNSGKNRKSEGKQAANEVNPYAESAGDLWAKGREAIA